jgi:general secretion pathway protein G
MENERVEKVGFTFMEIFIVVIILGIMASIVVPQFSRASSEARLSDLMSDLQDVRSQIELYRIQHHELLPGQSEVGGKVDHEKFVQDLTTECEQGFGPYMDNIPANVFNNKDTICIEYDKAKLPTGQEGTGWWLNVATGEFRACDSLENTHY